MSMVYITKHTENIYQLNKFDRSEVEEKIALQIINNSLGDRYISKYHNKVITKTLDVTNVGPFNKIVATKSTVIGHHRTMGYAKQPLKNPCDFLRKNEGITWKRRKAHICGKLSHPIPAIPKRSELPKKKIKVEKNIIKINIRNIKKCTVRQPAPKIALTHNGDTRELCNSGIMPAYIHSPTFGRLPKYILKFNKILCEKQKACEKCNRQKCDNKISKLDHNERIRIIKGLKSRWLELQSNFQTLPVFTDTILRIHRKGRMEKELRQLEDDILVVQNNPYIYVCD